MTLDEVMNTNPWQSIDDMIESLIQKQILEIGEEFEGARELAILRIKDRIDRLWEKTPSSKKLD